MPLLHMIIIAITVSVILVRIAVLVVLITDARISMFINHSS